MSELCIREREKWGFVTSVAAFKEQLIERNVYESSQLALQR